MFDPLEENFDADGGVTQDYKMPERQNKHHPLPLGLPSREPLQPQGK